MERLISILLLTTTSLHLVNGQGYTGLSHEHRYNTMVNYLCHKQPNLSICDIRNFKILGPAQNQYGGSKKNQ
ncbi:unnamed protein product [Bursaphelenchus okinawaensis]|uniref:Secreted protein n=1 Tax=Bursaphelenchus okinawaensis TaxID=465554 RepID=A0A811K8Y5_9BILA|nr:unnamed protein product [Bursaphelenchus okinawaensis]CAG9096853.1 unnamed protein product [Bursaphelenchus okinawaensis]